MEDNLITAAIIISSVFLIMVIVGVFSFLIYQVHKLCKKYHDTPNEIYDSEGRDIYRSSVGYQSVDPGFQTSISSISGSSPMSVSIKDDGFYHNNVDKLTGTPGSFKDSRIFTPQSQ
jgi:hypothetical protein